MILFLSDGKEMAMEASQKHVAMSTQTQINLHTCRIHIREAENQNIKGRGVRLSLNDIRNWRQNISLWDWKKSSSENWIHEIGCWNYIDSSIFFYLAAPRFREFGLSGLFPRNEFKPWHLPISSIYVIYPAWISA